MVNDMQSTVRQLGFRARKGQLPYPTDGTGRGRLRQGGQPALQHRHRAEGHRHPRGRKAPQVITIGTGTVVFSGWLKGYGNLVIVDHGSNYHSLYAHLVQQPGRRGQRGGGG